MGPQKWQESRGIPDGQDTVSEQQKNPETAQFTGFNIKATVAFNGLNRKSIKRKHESSDKYSVWQLKATKGNF